VIAPVALELVPSTQNEDGHHDVHHTGRPAVAGEYSVTNTLMNSFNIASPLAGDWYDGLNGPSGSEGQFGKSRIFILLLYGFQLDTPGGKDSNLELRCKGTADLSR
jgi:hypothetical protein